MNVREGRSVYASADASKSKKWVDLKEVRSSVFIKVGVDEAYLTPDQARRLARGLRTIALRIDKRNASAASGA